ncbi:GNAT family N-acetyltransferase [Paenibacillus sp. GSMTC-2017]|nr:GNAT family N-acetyltransferase [Paenibacillus sp. GSMTC-2017]MBH5320523.1 GNAT family N-acetyltransferase [Paenibacillus sp. GSMTC-2017]
MTIHPLALEHAIEICNWSYNPPYDIYNWPTWKQLKKDEIEFGDPVLRKEQYSAILDIQGHLIGFVQFFPMSNVTRLGLGLRPDLCGHGLGMSVVALITAEALRRTPDQEIDLEVLSWNLRAIRTYVKAGFHITDTYMRPTPNGMKECHCMCYNPST